MSWSFGVPGSPPSGLSGCSDLLHSDCWQKSSAELIAERAAPDLNGYGTSNVSGVIKQVSDGIGWYRYQARLDSTKISHTRQKGMHMASNHTQIIII